MGTLTETVPSRAVRARRGNRGLATALHLDLAYLLGDGAMQSFASVLLAPVFSIMFNGGAFVDGFGFRLGVVMAVFSPAMMVLTVCRSSTCRAGIGCAGWRPHRGGTRWPRGT